MGTHLHDHPERAGHRVTALLLALRLLSWNPVPDANEYRLYIDHQGVEQEFTILASPCPAGCSVQIEWPDLQVGEILYFQLYAIREGCEGVTAWPPV